MNIPKELKYTKSHEWLNDNGANKEYLFLPEPMLLHK